MRRSLLLPADRKCNPALAKLQASKRDRYQALLDSARFKGWASKADLAFKLTLAYFGLLVARLTIDFKQKLSLELWDSDGKMMPVLLSPRAATFVS